MQLTCLNSYLWLHHHSRVVQNVLTFVFIIVLEHLLLCRHLLSRRRVKNVLTARGCAQRIHILTRSGYALRKERLRLVIRQIRVRL